MGKLKALWARFVAKWRQWFGCKACGEIGHYAEDHCPSHPDHLQEKWFGCHACIFEAREHQRAEAAAKEEADRSDLAAKIAAQLSPHVAAHLRAGPDPLVLITADAMASRPFKVDVAVSDKLAPGQYLGPEMTGIPGKWVLSRSDYDRLQAMVSERSV